MTLPWGDWQFYVVTAVALWGARLLIRQLLPMPGSQSPCGSCAAGAAACVKIPEEERHSELVVLGPSGGVSRP